MPHRDLTAAAPPTSHILGGIARLAELYDGFVLDVWGVLHDGEKPYPGVLAALDALKTHGKRVVLLSNAPMRADGVTARIAGLGIPASAYNGVMTSGEEVWSRLKHRDNDFYAALGRRCLWLGPQRHAGVLEGLDYDIVTDLAQADFILNTGPDDLDEAATAYQPLLTEAARLDLPMICANADLYVMQGDGLICCAGILAKRYEDHGGTVRWHGKPHASVYVRCLDILGIADQRRILAIGDSLHTDIAGAAGAGIDSALVAGGIHATQLVAEPGGMPDAGKLSVLLAGAPFQPRWVIPQLMW